MHTQMVISGKQGIPYDADAAIYAFAILAKLASFAGFVLNAVRGLTSGATIRPAQA